MTSDLSVWRRPCTTPCRDCSNDQGCFDNGMTYQVSVTCQARYYDVSSEQSFDFTLTVDPVDPPAVTFPGKKLSNYGFWFKLSTVHSSVILLPLASYFDKDLH